MQARVCHRVIVNSACFLSLCADDVIPDPSSVSRDEFFEWARGYQEKVRNAVAVQKERDTVIEMITRERERAQRLEQDLEEAIACADDLKKERDEARAMIGDTAGASRRGGPARARGHGPISDGLKAMFQRLATEEAKDCAITDAIRKDVTTRMEVQSVAMELNNRGVAIELAPLTLDEGLGIMDKHVVMDTADLVEALRALRIRVQESRGGAGGKAPSSHSGASHTSSVDTNIPSATGDGKDMVFIWKTKFGRVYHTHPECYKDSYQGTVPMLEAMAKACSKCRGFPWQVATK